MARASGTSARLFTRNGHDWIARLKPLRRDLAVNRRSRPHSARRRKRPSRAGTFNDPKTGVPWTYQMITDVRSFWKITLTRQGIRYRRRGQHATYGIKSGARPTFLANQLSHSLQVFVRVYAKWINSKDEREEIPKLDQAIAQLSPNCPQPGHKVAEDASKS